MATYWPTSSDDYAVPMNEIPKVVFSKTLAEATWPESSVASGAACRCFGTCPIERMRLLP